VTVSEELWVFVADGFVMRVRTIGSLKYIKAVSRVEQTICTNNHCILQTVQTV